MSMLYSSPTGTFTWGTLGVVTYTNTISYPTATTSTSTAGTGSGTSSTPTPVPQDAISTVTGIDPNEVAAATMGKVIPIWVGGMPRMGCHIISGPTATITGGIASASFGVSFGMPANNLGDREIRELRLDGYKVWTLADGNLIPSLTFRFYPGTETQAADPQTIAAYPSASVAYKGQCVLFIDDLPLTDYANKVPFVSALIADISGGADPTDGINLGDGLEQIAASPYVDLSFEAVDISERVDAIIVAEKIAFIDLLVKYSTLHLWDVVQRDKLKIIERGTVTPDISLGFSTLLSAGGDQAPLIVNRQQQDELPKDLEYSYIDIDRDYEINTVRAQRMNSPVPVTVSAGVDTIALPSVHTAQEALSWVTLRAFKNENARDRASFTTGIYGYEIEPGDIVAVDAGFKNIVLRVIDTLHGADWTNRVTAEPVLRCATPIGTAPLDGIDCVSAAYSLSRQLLSSYVGPYYEAISTTVSRLYDQTGNERHFNDPGAGSRPAVTTAGSHSRTAANFDGVDDFMDTGLDLSEFTTASASYILISIIIDTVTLDDVDAQDNHAIIGDAGKKLGIYARDDSGDTTLYSYNFDGSADSAAHVTATGTPLVISLRHETGTLYIRVNNGTETSTASGDTSDLTGNLRLALSGAAQNADIKVFEVTTFDCVPPLGVRDALEQNYMTWVGASEEVVPGEFLPTDLTTLKAWYDFSDTLTITSSGGAVSQVLDKSGYGNHITQTIAGSRPTTGVSTLNSLNVVSFDGGDELTKTNSADLAPTSGCMVFALRLISSGTSAGLVRTLRTAGPDGDIATLARDAGSMGAYGNDVSDATASAAVYADSDNTSWHLSSGTYTLASRTIYEDGATQATTNSVIPDHTPDQIAIGHTLSRTRAANRFLTGQLAQVLVFSGTDTTTRQKIEGWAMWKYGLQAQLPVGHPYELAPP